MVNLNRQIRATQARQGGFSSHVLPGAVGYQPRPRWTLVPQQDGADWLIDTPSGAVVADVSNLGNATTSIETGAPWTMPHLRFNAGSAEFILRVPNAALPAFDVSTHTIEMWARLEYNSFNTIAGMRLRGGAWAGSGSGITIPQGAILELTLRGGSATSSGAGITYRSDNTSPLTGFYFHNPPGFAPTQPVHMRAVVSPSAVSLAVNGQQVYSAPLDGASFLNLDELRMLTTSAALGIDGNGTEVALSRYTPAALARDNFTPPQP